MHETPASHATDCRLRDVAARLGVACTVQADPFDASAIENPSCVDPTAVQPDAVGQLTPDSTASPTSALGSIVQARPFHDSASAVSVFDAPEPVNHPTAVHEAAPAHETASR